MESNTGKESVILSFGMDVTNLINVDRWVIKTAFKMIKEHFNSGITCSINDNLMKRNDLCLYDAKNNGRNKVVIK